MPGITANPTASLTSLVKRLAKHPLRARYVDGRGRRHGVEITRQDVFTMFVKGDTNPGTRARSPPRWARCTAATAGRWGASSPTPAAA